MLILLVLFYALLGRINCLFIEGCPLYGCRPSGSFSMYLDVPRKNVSIAWETKFVFDPVPDALGCVANDVNIICQSNGPFSEDKGYISLDGGNGTVHWRDKVLRFPSLPVMDNYGDVTGSDGTKLVHYDADGKLYPVIPCDHLKPVLSLQLVGTDFLLLVSSSGEIVVRDTNAVPVGFLVLKANIKGCNGTFVPISQPVVNGNRFYALTEFLPKDDICERLHIQRLYAVDVRHSLDNRIKVAWYYNFQGINKPSLSQNTSREQNLMWDSVNSLLYMKIPTSSNNPTKSTFYALKDSGNFSLLAFHFNIDVQHMAKFEANTDANEMQMGSNVSTFLWLASLNGTLSAITGNGSIVRQIDMAKILRSDVIITSKVVVARSIVNGSDILVFSVQAKTVTSDFISILKHYNISGPDVSSLIIAVDATVDPESNDVILWMFPVSGNMQVKGQVSGSRGVANQRKDQIIFYAEEEGKTAKVFSIH